MIPDPAEGEDATTGRAARVPHYGIPQPDGSEICLDFTESGGHGDFRVDIDLPNGVRHRVFVYHTGESRLFVHLLRCWAELRTPDQVLEEIAWVRGELAEMTEASEHTAESENDFDLYRDRIEMMSVCQPVAPVDYSAESNDQLTVAVCSYGLELSSERRNGDAVTVVVPSANIPVLVVGMIWRSYLPEDSGIPLTRLNTEAYLDALAVFETAIQRRRDTGGLMSAAEAPPPGVL